MNSLGKQSVDPWLVEILACPVCGSDVKVNSEALICTNDKCKLGFRVVDGIPIMISQYSKHREYEKQYFDREFNSYDKYELENWRISYLQRIFSALNIGNNSSDLYLDIGVGGSGYTVIEAARRGCKSVGMDISLEGVKKAWHFASSELAGRSNLCHFIVGLAENMPFKGSTFTKISSIAVSEHLPDDKQAIAEIDRVIKFSGRVFLTVPNAYRRILPIFWLPYYFWDKRIGHLRHYKAEDLIDDFAAYGFSIDGVKYSGHLAKILQILLSNVLKIKNPKLWWKLEEQDLDNNSPTGLQLTLILKKKTSNEKIRYICLRNNK